MTINLLFPRATLDNCSSLIAHRHQNHLRQAFHTVFSGAVGDPRCSKAVSHKQGDSDQFGRTVAKLSNTVGFAGMSRDFWSFICYFRYGETPYHCQYHIRRRKGEVAGARVHKPTGCHQNFKDRPDCTEKPLPEGRKYRIAFSWLYYLLLDIPGT